MINHDLDEGEWTPVTGWEAIGFAAKWVAYPTLALLAFVNVIYLLWWVLS